MGKVIIYHNPRCRKSREVLQILKEQGVDPEVREYLKEVPSVYELQGIFELLDMSPLQGIRQGEAVFKKNLKGKEMTDKEWLVHIHKEPILLERPIVINGTQAVIARPPEKVLEVL